MDFLIAVIIFTVSLVLSISNGVSTIYPLLAGMAAFSAVAYKRGHGFKCIAAMLLKGMKKALALMPIFALIGMITALWRAAGTISFFVYYGTKIMNPDYFILFAFLLTCVVSFALGTSFGTCGTIGVVLIVLAKSGGVNTYAAAGAIVSGAFFGDRCSPTSSSANLVAVVTDTDLYNNVKNMFITGFVPFVLTVIFYAFLSGKYPLNTKNTELLDEISAYFNLSFITVLPALVIFLLAIMKKNVKISMLVSIIASFVICLTVQNIKLYELFRTMLFGFYLNPESSLSKIISGGGLLSMVSVSCIVLIASSYSGIFEGTGMLNDIQGFVVKMSEKIGVYLTTLFTSLATCAFCCNQTLPILLTQQLMHKIYEGKGLPKEYLSIDIENTVILIAELFPWSIAIAVPLATLSVDAGAIPYAVFLYLVPIINVVRLPKWNIKRLPAKI
nr:Na+/H+ antiporter NhaC family protein [Sedimentibacter sp.]